MSLEAIPLPPPQPMIPDGDYTIVIATPANGEEKDSHQMLMEELKSFSSGNKKLRPVGIVNPRSRGQTETAKATAAPAHSPTKQGKIKAKSKPKQNNPVISTTKTSRKKVVKREESEDESSSKEIEDDTDESGESSQIQDLSKLISGLQQQLNLMAKKSKAKNKKKKIKRKPEIVHVDSTDSSNAEPEFEPKPIAEPPMETFETAATIPSPNPVESHIDGSSVEEEPCILHAPPKTPKVEANESPAVSPPGKDEILQRRASLRPKSSASFNFKTTPSTLRRKQEDESSPETPKYESFVEDFKNFSFKRKVVTNAHRKSSESSESQPVVNERILKKVESVHSPSKKVFSGKPSSAANEIEKKEVDAISVTKPATPLKKEKKKEKIIKPKLKVKPDMVEKVEPQTGKRSSENGNEEEPSPAFTLDWLIASISPDELLKLQQQLKGKMKGGQPKHATSEERATHSAPPRPPPPASTSAPASPEANGDRSLLFQQIKSFSKAKLRKAGCQSKQQPSPSSSKSTQQPNKSANSEMLKDALLRRFAALNSDEDEESDDDEVSSDSEESDTDEDWSEN